jgi:hypothetical protein
MHDLAENVVYYTIMRNSFFIIILLIATIAALPVSSDVIKLRNGDVLKGKIIKETENLVKVRMARRGKIVTCFLNRGTIESISKSPNEVNRAIFKKGGVRNPARDFAPVYYGGVTTGAAAPAGQRGGGAPGRKVAKKTTTRKRGVEARRERFSSGSRFGSKKATTATATGTGTGTRTGVGTSSASSPSTTGSSRTTSSSGFGTSSSFGISR